MEFLVRTTVGREKYADDRACGCDSERNAKASEHPFAVLSEPSVPDIPEPEAKTGQKP